MSASNLPRMVNRKKVGTIFFRRDLCRLVNQGYLFVYFSKNGARSYERWSTLWIANIYVLVVHILSFIPCMICCCTLNKHCYLGERRLSSALPCFSGQTISGGDLYYDMLGQPAVPKYPAFVCRWKIHLALWGGRHFFISRILSRELAVISRGTNLKILPSVGRWRVSIAFYVSAVAPPTPRHNN